MKSQTHERRLEFSGAVARAQKESWPVDLWTTKIDMQLPGSHAKGKPCKKKVQVHNLHIHSCLPFT